MYEIITNRGVTWIEDYSLMQFSGIKHAFSTRLGGVSSYPWRSLNLGMYTKDSLVNIKENRRRFITNFGISPSQVLTLKFIHSNQVVCVTSDDLNDGYMDPLVDLAHADAMVTNDTDLALFLTYADCTPVLFYEPNGKIIGAAHVGWRGLVDGIAYNTVEAMVQTYNACRKKIITVIGPHIRQNDFEVGSEVIKKIKKRSGAWTELLISSRDGKAYFNSEKALIWQLEAAGVLKENISSVDLSTFKRRDLFFSHRRDFGMSGRMGVFIMMEGK